MIKMTSLIANVIFIALVGLGIGISIYLISKSGSTSSDNNVYVRYNACALSIPPNIRTKDNITACWEHVMEEANREVHRYDKLEDDNHHWLKGE